MVWGGLVACILKVFLISKYSFEIGSYYLIFIIVYKVKGVIFILFGSKFRFRD